MRNFRQAVRFFVQVPIVFSLILSHKLMYSAVHGWIYATYIPILSCFIMILLIIIVDFQPEMI